MLDIYETWSRTKVKPGALVSESTTNLTQGSIVLSIKPKIFSIDPVMTEMFDKLALRRVWAISGSFQANISEKTRAFALVGIVNVRYLPVP